MASSFVITPSTGQSPLFTQAGPGASPGYGAIDDRRALAAVQQEGVMDVHSFEVTQHAAGANLTVDVAASTVDAQGSGIAAAVQGDTITAQGLYFCPPHSAVGVVDIATANVTNPRVDRVVLEIQDNTVDSSGQNRFQCRVISGTASSGATLDNLTGAAAVPVNCLLLADVLVPANDTAISNSQIRDRRKWARGVRYITSNVLANSTTSSTPIDVGAAGTYTVRVECSGVPLRVTLDIDWRAASSGKLIAFDLKLDGSQRNDGRQDIASAVLGYQHLCMEWLITPSAGSHVIGPTFASVDNATSVTLSSAVATFALAEVVGQSAVNNSTTSG